MRADERAVESALLVPIVDQGKAIGISLVVRTSAPPFDAGSLRALARLTEETSAAVRNALSVRRTRELVIKDDLTDSYNRRYFETALEDELQRTKRYGTHLSLIFLDLDNLKAINNQHGHYIGSKTLQEVAHRVILTVRGIDKVVRYGGDEFCIILPETDIEGANRVAERIRQNVAQAPFLTQEGLSLRMTVSIGIASCPLHARTKEELVKKADMAMFQSKAATKNVVTVAS
jgi:diguanylate cyclase (GGDEF)-like protein